MGLAALAGWGVARAGLAPVGRLAAVAEQVTATGDPGRRVEVGRADELGRLAASFNTMLGALQRSLAAQRQLVSDAGHELRTPLTSLRINAELLAAEPGLPAAERQEVLDRMVAQVAELGQLVSEVTELARGETLDAPADVDFAEVVTAALDGARRDWPAAVFEADLVRCSRCAATIPSTSLVCPECAATLLGEPGEERSDPERSDGERSGARPHGGRSPSP